MNGYRAPSFIKVRPLFFRYQQQLLMFANTNLGRDTLRIKTDNKIVKISPDGYHELIGIEKDRAIIKATFFPKSPFLRTFRRALETMSLAESDYGDRGIWTPEKQELIIPQYQGLIAPRLELPNYYFASPLTVYPDPDPETTTVDGPVYYVADATSFATARGAANGTGATPSGANIQIDVYHSAANHTDLGRGIMLFDTSSLTAAVNVTAAVVSLYGQSKNDGANDANGYCVILTSTPASNTNLVVGDYSQIGTVEQSSRVDTTDFSTAGYNAYTLNATGIGNVSKTGVSKFGCREGHDLNNSAPPNDADCYQQFYSADTALTDKDPKLVVTYVLPSGGCLLMFQ